jgi:hypothetical protein
MIYPIINSTEKFIKRNQPANRLLLFLPEIRDENVTCISHAKTRKGSPRSNEISVTFRSSSPEISGERKELINT